MPLQPSAWPSRESLKEIYDDVSEARRTIFQLKEHGSIIVLDSHPIHFTPKIDRSDLTEFLEAACYLLYNDKTIFGLTRESLEALVDEATKRIETIRTQVQESVEADIAISSESDLGDDEINMDIQELNGKELLEVRGIGEAKLADLLAAGIHDKVTLREAAKTGKLVNLKGFGPKTVARILSELGPDEAALNPQIEVISADELRDGIDVLAMTYKTGDGKSLQSEKPQERPNLSEEEKLLKKVITRIVSLSSKIYTDRKSLKNLEKSEDQGSLIEQAKAGLKEDIERKANVALGIFERFKDDEGYSDELIRCVDRIYQMDKRYEGDRSGDERTSRGEAYTRYYKLLLSSYILTHHVRFRRKVLEDAGLMAQAEEDKKYEMKNGKSFAQLATEANLDSQKEDDPEAFRQRLLNVEGKELSRTKRKGPEARVSKRHMHDTGGSRLEKDHRGGGWNSHERTFTIPYAMIRKQESSENGLSWAESRLIGLVLDIDSPSRFAPYSKSDPLRDAEKVFDYFLKNDHCDSLIFLVNSIRDRAETRNKTPEEIERLVSTYLELLSLYTKTHKIKFSKAAMKELKGSDKARVKRGGAKRDDSNEFNKKLAALLEQKMIDRRNAA